MSEKQRPAADYRLGAAFLLNFSFGFLLTPAHLFLFPFVFHSKSRNWKSKFISGEAPARPDLQGPIPGANRQKLKDNNLVIILTDNYLILNNDIKNKVNEFVDLIINSNSNKYKGLTNKTIFKILDFKEKVLNNI